MQPEGQSQPSSGVVPLGTAIPPCTAALTMATKPGHAEAWCRRRAAIERGDFVLGEDHRDTEQHRGGQCERGANADLRQCAPARAQARRRARDVHARCQAGTGSPALPAGIERSGRLP